MKSSLRICLIAWLALTAVRASAADFYVSRKGDDASAGSAAFPFATLERGVQASRDARNAGQSGAATVWLEDGIYRITNTLTLDAADERIAIRAVHDGHAILDAGVAVPPTAFVISDDLHFADAATMNFRTATDALVFRKVPGFTAIPFGKIGLYLDEHRQFHPVHPNGQSVSEWRRSR
jgi:hypothetical protein